MSENDESKDKIPGLISRLHEALEHTEGTNTELQAKVKQVEEQLVSGEDDSLMDQLNLLETEFANEHPVAEGIIREIISILGRMGI